MFNLFLKDFLITKDVKLVIVFIMVLIVYWLKNKLFRKLIFKIIKRTPTTMDDDIFPLFDQALNLFIFGSGFVALLLHFGIDLKSLLATAGIGTIAVAFAVKDVIIDVISGFMIVIDKPFRVGNYIKLVSGESVKVLDIGLRKSKFLYEGKRKSVLIISNIDLIKNKIYNYSYAEEL